MKLSIIIPTNGRPAELTRALESIFAQTYTNYEIIIVDDRAEHNSEICTKPEILQKKNVACIVNKKRLNAGLSRQKGYLSATGDLIIFMDDDDYYTDRNFFKNAIVAFQNKNIIALCADSNIAYEKNDESSRQSKLNFGGYIDASEYFKGFQTLYSKPTSTFPLVIRKRLADQVGFKKMKMMNDTCIYLRFLLNNGVVAHYRKSAGTYVIHPNNFSKDIDVNFVLDVLREKLDIYKLAVARGILERADKKWINRQTTITVKYFLTDESITISKVSRLLKWLLQNLGPFYAFITIFRLLKILLKRFYVKNTNE